MNDDLYNNFNDNLIYHLDNNSVSTASLLAEQCYTHHGILPTQICANDISTTYETMKRIDQAADLSCIESLVSPQNSSVVLNDPVCGVIVETRKHHALATVIANVFETCHVPVQLFHGQGNLGFILDSEIADMVAAGKVFLTALNADHLSASEYNALLLAPQFWQQMIGRKKILIFQTDSLCCPASDYTLSQFMAFDYIGACWNPQRPVGLVINGGCGGFSLRDWSVSMDCLLRFPAHLWGGGEDGYYAFHMELIGANVATQRQSAMFATQDHFQYRSFAAHAIQHLPFDKKQQFVDYCPEAKLVFPNVS